MTGLTLECPLDEATEDYAEELVEPGDPSYAYPDPDDPGPGDPGTERPAAVVRSFGRRVQMLLCEPVTHRPLAEVRSAIVEAWSERFGPSDATFSVDTFDPAWRHAAERTTTCRGRTVSQPDLKGLEVAVGEDGVRQWSGVLQEPHSWPVGRVQIKAKSPEALWSERTLGETEQRDYYQGRGSFPATDLSGWEFSDGVTHSFTSDSYEGARALTFTTPSDGGGTVYGPWVTMLGAEGQTRYPVGSALLRIADGAQVYVGVDVQKVDGTPVNPDFTVDALGQADDTNTLWQGPVAGKGKLSAAPVVHRVRVKVYAARSLTVKVDLVRLQWPTLTGYPNDQDLARYPGRIVRDAQFGPGGCNLGIVPVIRTLTGTLDHLTWPHQDDHPVDEAISTVTDMLGGPDVWVTPGWRMMVARRRGRDRRDLMLHSGNIIEATPTLDPGGQIDELRGLTDIGQGSYRHVFSFSGPVVGNRRRIRQLVPTPNGLEYDAAKRWTNGQGEFASRTPFSASVDVDYDLGARFAVGDGVRFAYDNGEWAWWGAVRIGAKTMRPKVGRCTLEVGTDPVVAL